MRRVGAAVARSWGTCAGARPGRLDPMLSTFSELHRKAEGLVQARRLHQALAIYQALDATCPPNLQTLCGLQAVYKELGRMREYRECLLRDAEVRARDGFHLQAIAVYRAAFRLDRSDAGKIFLAISRLYRQIGLPGWAGAELLGAIAAFHTEGRTEGVVEAFAELDPPELRPS